jgi:hypothetical protein
MSSKPNALDVEEVGLVGEGCGFGWVGVASLGWSFS